MRRADAGSGPAVGGSGGSYAEQDFTPATLRTAVDGSLRRLGTDYVDVLQLHGPDQVMPDLFEQLDELVTAGKVRRFGVGAESVDAAQQWIGVRGAAVVQLPFGVLDPEAAEIALPTPLVGPPRCGPVACSVVGCWRLPCVIRPPSPTIRKVR